MCQLKSNLFVKLTEKIEISRKFAWKKSKLCWPGSTTPRFQTRLTPPGQGW